MGEVWLVVSAIIMNLFIVCVDCVFVEIFVKTMFPTQVIDPMSATVPQSTNTDNHNPILFAFPDHCLVRSKCCMPTFSSALQWDLI